MSEVEPKNLTFQQVRVAAVSGFVSGMQHLLVEDQVRALARVALDWRAEGVREQLTTEIERRMLLEEQLTVARAEIETLGAYKIVEPWVGTTRMRCGMVKAIVHPKGWTVYHDDRSVASGPEMWDLGRHCADQALMAMGCVLPDGPHPAPVVECEWFTATVPVGSPPLGMTIPRGWHVASEWEVVTAVSHGSGLSMIWKVRIGKRGGTDGC